MNSLVPTSKEHSKTDRTWADILSCFCWTNLKEAIRSVIHSKNKHGMIPIQKKKKKRNKHGMICSHCSMENLAQNMKRVTVCLLGHWYSFLLYFHAYNC